MDKKATLDLTGCKYLDELHQRIKKALDFPEWYGANWDAFWDCINRECDADKVEIVGSSSIAKELENSFEVMIKLLEDNKRYWANSDCPFDYEIIN